MLSLVTRSSTDASESAAPNTMGPTGFVTSGTWPQVFIWDFRCACKFVMHEKRHPQAGHINRFRPVCCDTCVSRLSRYANDFGQNCNERKCNLKKNTYLRLVNRGDLDLNGTLTSHWNGFSPLCLRSWTFTWPWVRKAFPQKLHRWGSSPVCTVECVFSEPALW